MSDAGRYTAVVTVSVADNHAMQPVATFTGLTNLGDLDDPRDSIVVAALRQIACEVESALPFFAGPKDDA